MRNRKKHQFLNYEDAHTFVEKSGNNVYWDGWEIVIFHPTRGAYMRRNGAYRNGKWGISNRIACNNKGLWRVPVKDERKS